MLHLEVALHTCPDDMILQWVLKSQMLPYHGFFFFLPAGASMSAPSSACFSSSSSSCGGFLQGHA